jgi:hypothetical protein
MARRRLASALSSRCFPVGHHQLQRPRPNVYPAVPSSPPNAPEVHAPPPKVGLHLTIFDRGKTYRTGRAGDLGASIAQIYFFKSPMHMAFPRVVDPADRVVGPLGPLPRQA